MNDARYTNGHPPPAANGAPSPWRRFTGTFMAITGASAALALLTGAAIFVAEATLSSDHEWRPANILARFEGDWQSGVSDRMEAVRVKWGVIEKDATAKIERETAAVTQEVQTRAEAVQKRIDAAESQIAPRQINNILGEVACAYSAVESGLIRACETGKAHRRDVMAERDALIGDVKVLYSDAEVTSMIGLPKNFMDQFESAAE